MPVFVFGNCQFFVIVFVAVVVIIERVFTKCQFFLAILTNQDMLCVFFYFLKLKNTHTPSSFFQIPFFFGKKKKIHLKIRKIATNRHFQNWQNSIKLQKNAIFLRKLPKNSTIKSIKFTKNTICKSKHIKNIYNTFN